MLTNIVISYIRYSGYFGYVLQKGESTIQIPNKIECIVLYKYDKEAKEAKKLLSFNPHTETSDPYEFYLDIPKMDKVITHRNSSGIKPKEDFSYCNQGNAFWVNADSINLSGPHYQKIDHVINRGSRIPIYGSPNYEIRESYTWNGGSYKNRKWIDYLQFLDLKYELENKFRELRWTSGDTLDIVDQAIQALEDFKKASHSLMKIWQEGDVDTLVLYCQERDIKPKKGGEN